METETKSKSHKPKMDDKARKHATEFGDIVRAKRKELKWLLKDAAAKIGIAPPYLSDIEKGRERPPSPQVVTKLAYLYGFNNRMINHLNQLSRCCRGHVGKGIADLINESDDMYQAMLELCEMKASFESRGATTELKDVLRELQGIIYKFTDEKLAQAFPEQFGHLTKKIIVGVEIPEDVEGECVDEK